MGKLAVHVVEAKEVPSMDLVGNSDAYVSLTVGSAKLKTQIMKDSMFPIWNEHFQVKYDESATEIEFKLMDSDHGKKDDEIGTVKFQISNLKPGPNDLWFEFAEVKKMKPKLHVVISKIASLSIKVVKAANLKAMDLNGKSDPYVEIVYEKLKEKTKHINKTLNPEWNETFEFDLTNMDEPIFFNVYDKDLLTKDDLIGTVLLTTTMLKNGLNKLELKLPDQGALYLEITASNLN